MLPRETTLLHESEQAERDGEVARRELYVPGLDGLRAFAVIAVWLLHMDRAHFPGGAVGVDVFFALSAYLITGILWREALGGPVSLSAFYWRRAFRLFPALVLCVVLVAIPSMLVNHESSQVPWVGGALVYINDFLAAWTHRVPGPVDQTWSLAVEEQFYLVWPVILLFVLPRISLQRQSLFFAGVALLAVVLLVSGRSNYFLPTGHLLPLALGAWAAAVKRRLPELPQIPVGAGWLAACVLVALLFINVTSTQVNAAVAIVGSLAAVAMILYLDGGRPSPLKWTLEHPVTTWLGARSYGIYLYGLSLIGLVSGVTHLKLHIAVFVDAAVALALVAVSYRYVEAPVRRWGRRWIASR